MFALPSSFSYLALQFPFGLAKASSSHAVLKQPRYLITSERRAQLKALFDVPRPQRTHQKLRACSDYIIFSIFCCRVVTLWQRCTTLPMNVNVNPTHQGLVTPWIAPPSALYSHKKPLTLPLLPQPNPRALRCGELPQLFPSLSPSVHYLQIDSNNDVSILKWMPNNTSERTQSPALVGLLFCWIPLLPQSPRTSGYRQRNAHNNPRWFRQNSARELQKRISVLLCRVLCLNETCYRITIHC